MALGCAALLAQEQQPNAPAPPSAPAQRGSSSSATVFGSKPLPSYLIIGTVYNENALSFPGVQVRIRRAGEKKFRWETYTNSRGEFAVRVFPGYEYELVTRVKKYQEQTHAVDAKVDVQQRLSIKLEPVEHAKNGGKS